MYLFVFRDVFVIQNLPCFQSLPYLIPKAPSGDWCRESTRSEDFPNWWNNLWQSLMDTMLTYKLALNRLLGCFWSFTKTARLVRILRFLTEQLIHSFGFGEFRRQYSLTYGCSKTNKDWPWMSAAGLQICPWSPRVVAEIARGSKPRLLIICDEGIEVFLQEWVVRMVVVRMTGPLGLYFGD